VRLHGVGRGKCAIMVSRVSRVSTDKKTASLREISAGLGGVTVSMVTKFDQIGEALDAGKTSSQIAKELRVSLKDVQKVRVERGLDLGAKQREYATLLKAIAVSQKGLTARELELQRLDEQLAVRKRELADLDKEIVRKKEQRGLMLVYIEAIHIPSNDSEVRAYLAKLDLERLKWFIDTVYSIRKAKQLRELKRVHEQLEAARLEALRRELASLR